ncbi:hypothetical protein MKW92_041467 [Papaver armeniacum]|nr:hypothetical protein MKW92_041467 [Papaver armeniacum]
MPSSDNNNNNNISGVSWYSSTHSKINYRARRFLDGARRFYREAYDAYEKHKNTLITVGLVVGGVVTAVWGSERIPYSERIHLIFLSKDFERKIGKRSYNGVLKKYEGKILPETHPESVRVRLIAKDIIEALRRGLRYEQVGSDLEYNKEVDKEVQEIAGQAKKGSQVVTYHLEGLDWEILVVDEPTVNAICMPGGKIVVFTGLLNRFKSDAEVATILAHEVGHVVARHGAENITNTMCFVILRLILSQFANTNEMTNLDKAYKTLLHLPFSRRMEKEADYIGLLLLASAGYDPRGAPQVYEKLGDGKSSWSSDYLSTHPSGKKRAQLLSQEKVMEEALSIYRKSNSGRVSKASFEALSEEKLRNSK